MDRLRGVSHPLARSCTVDRSARCTQAIEPSRGGMACSRVACVAVAQGWHRQGHCHDDQQDACVRVLPMGAIFAAFNTREAARLSFLQTHAAPGRCSCFWRPRCIRAKRCGASPRFAQYGRAALYGTDAASYFPGLARGRASVHRTPPAKLFKGI